MQTIIRWYKWGFFKIIHNIYDATVSSHLSFNARANTIEVTITNILITRFIMIYEIIFMQFSC